jgi:hypothetical protein
MYDYFSRSMIMDHRNAVELWLTNRQLRTQRMNSPTTATVLCFSPHNRNSKKPRLLFLNPQTLRQCQLNITDRNPISTLPAAGSFSRDRSQWGNGMGGMP